MNSNLAMDNVRMEEKVTALDEVILFSRFNEKIKRLTDGIASAIENDKKSMPEPVYEKYKEIVSSLFNCSELNNDVRKLMSESYDVITFGEMIKFLTHPHIKIMNQREENAKSLEATQEMQGFFFGFQESPPSVERKSLIEQVDRVNHFSLVVIETQVELFRAISFGMRGLSANDQQATETQLNLAVADMKTKMGAQMQQQVWLGMLYAYRDISDNELNDYLMLCESTAGKLTAEFTRAIFNKMYKRAANGLQKDLEALFA